MASKKTIMSWITKKKQMDKKEEKNKKKDKEEEENGGKLGKNKRRKKNDYEFDHLNAMDGAEVDEIDQNHELVDCMNIYADDDDHAAEEKSENQDQIDIQSSQDEDDDIFDKGGDLKKEYKAKYQKIREDQAETQAQLNSKSKNKAN